MTAVVQSTNNGEVVYNSYAVTVHVCLWHRSLRITEYAEEKRREEKKTIYLYAAVNVKPK